MRNWFFVSILFVSFKAHSYKISIYTDETSNTKASEVAKLIQTTYPFNQFELDFEIVGTTSQNLNCKLDEEIARLINCEGQFVQDDSLKRLSDQALIISDIKKYGGSGGSIPVITSDSPASMMLHEYLHTLGFSDEYDYSELEAEFHCKDGIKSANLVTIYPLSPYIDDANARSLHSSEIPWYSEILPTTPITNSNGRALGTGKAEGLAPVNLSSEPSSLGGRIGLYQGKTCDKAVPKIYTWLPGGENTIMLELEAGIGKANEKILHKILLSRGVKLKSACHKCQEEIPKK